MSPPSLSSARLDVTQGPLQGQSLVLTVPEIVTGREADCGLDLSPYREVSRRHARFYLQNGTWCVEDLGSTNGTFVNNVRATPAFSLSDGAQIQMGDFRARFRLAAVEVQPRPLYPNPTQQSLTPQAPSIPSPVVPVPVVPVVVVPVPVQPYPVIYPPDPPKQVALALLFGFILVGGGQFYNGEAAKGVALLCSHIFCFFIGLFTFGLMWFFCFGIWVYGIIDAVQTAERINRASGWPGPRSY